MEWTRGKVIGQGSSATVSIATSRRTGQVFAVKTAELGVSQFLQTEQEILSSLRHPRVVGYRGWDVTWENGKLFYNLFMELSPEGTLADEIHRRGGVLNESMIGFFTWQILQGLEYLHSQCLVHCDVKSRNILICDDGAKVADFGSSKRAEEPAVRGGTPMFMAPEVVRGEDQGRESDIWGLGCTVIEMATGGSPWPCINDSPLSVLYRVGYSGDSPAVPTILSDQGKDFLEKCLRKNPKKRWTAGQLLRHAFIKEFSSGQNLSQKSYSISPTSTLEQSIWRSSEELENHSDVADDRIRRLSLSSGGEPEWERDENWIGVRGEEVDMEEEKSCSELSENNNPDVNDSANSRFLENYAVIRKQSCKKGVAQSSVSSNSSFL